MELDALLLGVVDLLDARRRLGLRAAVDAVHLVRAEAQAHAQGIPNTDDMRDAPSIDITNSLIAQGARVRVYDPVAIEVAKPLLPEAEFCPDPYAMATGCDALIVITEWKEFKQLDLEKIKAFLRNPVIFDGRNIYDPGDMKKAGFIYRGFGRGYNGSHS